MSSGSDLSRLRLSHLLVAALVALLLLRLFSAIFAGAGAGAGIPAGPGAGEADEVYGEDSLPVLQVSFLLLAQNAIVLGVLLVLLRTRGIPLAALGLRAVSARVAWREVGFALLLIPFFAMLNFLFLVFYARYFGGEIESSQLPLLLSGRSTPFADALFFAAAAGIAPVVEELTFRGLVFSWAATRVTVRTAAFASALIFAVVHLPPGIMPLMFVFGLIMVWRYLVTGSLWGPILVHVVFNGVNVWLFYVLREVVAAGGIPAATIMTMTGAWH
ncbi:MAG: CPBP family intramembrane metalloprotease [Alphaproteobacteria bacterium]|nr:CPBP family intramembrane metalloprotease [Alphaproteobacteria bacterium]MDA7983212.1 CPBP family intramembrane metalloprotease [Alphaproteobacteria bacterium]MDA7984271.1 CPBP family intramembrane metalloprotease [Alphaproteobacteria bacterium]MDA8008825.1 CPBP family intramembrane metalloprotease [Alphaproteobacteria bacterium]